MVQRFCQERSEDPEKRVSVAWHHKRGWLPTADFVEKPIEDDQDQISPGTWTTLPDEFDLDGWPFDVTDPEEPVHAALFSRFNAREYDRIEIGVNGDRRGRYTVRKEDLESFLRDIHERFSDRY